MQTRPRTSIRSLPPGTKAGCKWCTKSRLRVPCFSTISIAGWKHNLVNTINVEQIPLLSQPTRVSGFGVTYARDRRNNPADASRGTFNTIDVSDAIQSIGSSASFLRVYMQNSSFHSFGRAFVFARSVRFGFEQPFGDTLGE